MKAEILKSPEEPASQQAASLQVLWPQLLIQPGIRAASRCLILPQPPTAVWDEINDPSTV